MVKKKIKKKKCPFCKSKNWKSFIEVSGYWCQDCRAAWETWSKDE